MFRKPETTTEMASTNWKSSRIVKKNANIDRIFIKEETKAHVKKVSAILKKAEANRTEDEWRLLEQSDDVVEVILKRTQVKEQTRQRHLEIEDCPDLLQDKCEKLASVIRSAKSLAVYTGAGISTAASIPDYRGPNGVWTLLKQGKQLRSMDLCDAEPTLTHMAIVELYKRGFVKHVVSQNCDGLHLRSGLPRSALSELHGNMYIEVCRECQPPVEYVRLFDVTERTAMRRHKTGRRCLRCSSALFDTIVHFGEKGAIEAPYNWHQAVEAANSADVILCLGSSLKVLKKYACLWGMHKPVAKRPRLFIVNLQWTPKDPVAALKINGRCDHVMHLLMKHLEIDIPPYFRNADPIFALASQLRANEDKSTTKKMLIAQLVSSSSSSVHCSRLVHSEGKWGKDRRIKKQQLSGLPIRVMPPRRAKNSSQRTVRISKKPLTICGNTPEGVENSTGNCGFVVVRAAKFDKDGSGMMEWSNIEKAEYVSSEEMQKHFCGCSSPTSISRVREFKLQSVMDRPLEESSAVVSSCHRRLTGFQGMSWRGFECSQLLNEMDGNCVLDRTNGVGSFWWDKIDSRTWLEALQAYLLHVSSGRRMNGAEGGNSSAAAAAAAAAAAECHFTESSVTGASTSRTGFCHSGDDVVGCDVSERSMGELFTEASKEPASVDVSNVPALTDPQKQLDSGEECNRLSEQNRKCHCSEKLSTDSKESVEEASKLELLRKCSDEWLSHTSPLKNSSCGSDIVPCERRLCEVNGVDDEQAIKLCTLSDLKVMHNVLFDSKGQSSSPSAAGNVCKEVGCLAVTALLPAESKPLNDATLELNVMDVNSNARSLIANADLVRFMHSYCQQEIGNKQDNQSSRKPTDISLLSRSPPSGHRMIPVSFVDFIKEIICSRKETEQIWTDLGMGQIRRNQVNGKSETVTGVRSFHLEDTLKCLLGSIAQQKQCCSSASSNFVGKRDGNCDDHSTVVSHESCQDVGKSSCLTENCCDMSSRNVDGKCHINEKKRKHDFISTPGWFGKGISLRKRKRKIVK